MTFHSSGLWAAIAARSATASRFVFRLHFGKLEARPAIETSRVCGIAVQFDHVLLRDPGHLVEVVDILRDDAGRFAAAIESFKSAYFIIPPEQVKLHH